MKEVVRNYNQSYLGFITTLLFSIALIYINAMVCLSEKNRHHESFHNDGLKIIQRFFIFSLCLNQQVCSDKKFYVVDDHS